MAKRDEEFWEEVELDEDIYNSKKRKEMLEDDDIDPLDEAFMQGYEEG